MMILDIIGFSGASFLLPLHRVAGHGPSLPGSLGHGRVCQGSGLDCEVQLTRRPRLSTGIVGGLLRGPDESMDSKSRKALVY